jgi:hypothetical protein
MRLSGRFFHFRFIALKLLFAGLHPTRIIGFDFAYVSALFVVPNRVSSDRSTEGV